MVKTMDQTKASEMSERSQTAPRGQRGPADHERREQIMTAADEHFRLYGYNKTTIADLAKAIGLSSGYIYLLFESKQAIGEAICQRCLGRIQGELQLIAQERTSASDRIRRIYESLVKQSKAMFFNERKLHDIVVVSLTEGWESSTSHDVRLQSILRQVVVEGRESGEFERKTPLDETCEAIMQTLLPFSHPILLEKNLDRIESNATAVANLVLRSLAV
jgi:AcrR family transcriptional regulator